MKSYGPTPRLTLLVDRSDLNASVKPKILSGGANSICLFHSNVDATDADATVDDKYLLLKVL